MASFHASLAWWIWPHIVRAWPACGCRGKLSTKASSTCRASTQRFWFFSSVPIWKIAFWAAWSLPPRKKFNSW